MSKFVWYDLMTPDMEASSKFYSHVVGWKIADSGMPGVGRFAVIADPTGATFLLFKNHGGESPAPVAEGTPGHIGWRELMSGNWEKAWDFYAGMFGWTKDEAMDMGPMGTYQMFKSGDEVIGGMMTKPKDDPMPPHWNYYFNVDSAEAAMARATSLGAKITSGPMQVPGGSWALNGIDPQGAAFSLLSINK